MNFAAVPLRQALTRALFGAALACACGVVWAAPAAPADSAPQTLPQLVEALKHGNPQLEQARQAYLAARQLVPQVSSLPAPQFSLL
ncbi:MAG: hypothetical protein P4L83_09260, partial [Nevskia sp.]|nr:hypothetical protein [Nevskia sp.]